MEQAAMDVLTKQEQLVARAMMAVDSASEPDHGSHEETTDMKEKKRGYVEPTNVDTKVAAPGIDQAALLDDLTQREHREAADMMSVEEGVVVDQTVLEQIQPLPLHRSRNIQQQQEPGAYMAVPGGALHRNENIRLSLVGGGAIGIDGFPPVSGNHQQLIEETPNVQTRTAGNTGLVEARAVTDESSMNFLQEAQQVDVDALAQSIKGKKERQCHRAGYALLAFALCILVISLGIALGTRRDQVPPSESPTVYLSMEPSRAPSSAPTGELDALFKNLPKNTQDNIQKGSTPQYKAWEWLSYHRNNTYLPEWRKKQLFVLAMFFFAFEGENWNELIRKRWLDDTKEECLWFSGGFGRFVDGEYEEWPEHLGGTVPPCNQLGEFTLLDLQDLQLSGYSPSIPPEIVLLTSLSTIALYEYGGLEMSLTSFLPSELYQMLGLETLWIYGNNITGHIPSEFGLMTSLIDLDLNSNLLSGLLPSELGLLTSLEHLGLDSNLLLGPLPSELGGMANMKNLRFDYNALTGWLPRELGFMTNLTQLCLDGNHFSGSLQSELVGIAGMSKLWLGGNGFSGTIPSELGSANLTILMLGGNMWSGTIPQEIWQLSYLYHVDLSNLPLLTGPIEPSELGYWDFSGSLGLSGTIPVESCFLQNSSCTFDHWDLAEVWNCALIFECTELLCGCDCPCPNASLGVGV